MNILEYSDIVGEMMGSSTTGRLTLTKEEIIFDSKNGEVKEIDADDIKFVNYENFGGFFNLRICMNNLTVHRYTGFKSDDRNKITEYFKDTYHKNCLEKKLSLKGLNWGRLHFTGSALRLDCESKTSFEIPLQHVKQWDNGVKQCTTDNEVTMEFHSNDAPVSLIEMRMYIPNESSDIEPVDEMKRSFFKQSVVKSMSDDAIAIFKEIQCLTPRGHYEIKVFRAFFHLHGKTFDYKIRMSTVLQMFLLPHKDSRQMFLVLSLDTPIKQGQTSYHHLVFLFTVEEEIKINLPFSNTELKRKYKGTKTLSGRVYEVFDKLMKGLINRKFTKPGYIGYTDTPAIDCSYKTDAGYLYPLEKGFIYVHKPTIYISFDEITSVNFARIGSSSVSALTRTFDFEIELKYQTVHTFSGIANEEYSQLFDFANVKKLHLKNSGKNHMDNLLDMMDKSTPFKPSISVREIHTPSPVASPVPSFSSSDDENIFPLPQVTGNAPHIPTLFDINVGNW